jgi:hypothetical protein
MRALLVIAILAASTTLTAAQGTDQPKADIDCSAFQREPNGIYKVTKPTMVIIGQSRMGIGQSTIGPHGMMIGGVDLYEYLERNCKGAPI